MDGSGCVIGLPSTASPDASTVRFAKYHALGNDYLVLEASEWPALDAVLVRRVCDRHRGVGSDGLVVRQGEGLAVEIFNPDGSKAEKSGNGLRIFARYLWDRGLVGEASFVVSTESGDVTCRIRGESVIVDMGRVSFDSAEIPVAGPRREVLEETLRAGDQSLSFSAATIGNPHCVILRERASDEEARTLGPLVEHDSRFPNRTNVQFVEVLDRANLKLEIWERGAGYTLASGSSSCAAAAVVKRLGLCDGEVTVHMPGGRLTVEIDDAYRARLTGPVVRVAEGRLFAESLSQG
jgi:diaminopimelate epimerase